MLPEYEDWITGVDHRRVDARRANQLASPGVFCCRHVYYAAWQHNTASQIASLQTLKYIIAPEAFYCLPLHTGIELRRSDSFYYPGVPRLVHCYIRLKTTHTANFQKYFFMQKTILLIED